MLTFSKLQKTKELKNDLVKSSTPIGIFEYATRFGNSMTNVSAYLSPLSFAIRFNVVAGGTRIRLTIEFNLWIARTEHIPAADTTNKLRMPID